MPSLVPSCLSGYGAERFMSAVLACLRGSEGRFRKEGKRMSDQLGSGTGFRV